eukprot:11163678-Lingulodinium_polyedra.AAC.1
MKHGRGDFGVALPRAGPGLNGNAAKTTATQCRKLPQQCLPNQVQTGAPNHADIVLHPAFQT